ncbi:PREDICTED: uncharacterized protein LOC101312537 [Fragaria vesca subsp. vesca]
MTGGSGVENFVSQEQFAGALEKLCVKIDARFSRFRDKTGEYVEKITDLSEVTTKPKTLFMSESHSEPHIWRKQNEAAKVDWLASNKALRSSVKLSHDVFPLQNSEEVLQRQEVEPTAEKHIFAKEVESPCDQSSGESFFLDESASGRTDLPTYGESRTEHERENDIKQSCSNEEIVPFVDEDVYMDTGQRHGGQTIDDASANIYPLADQTQVHSKGKHVEELNDQATGRTLTFPGREFHDDGTSHTSRRAAYNLYGGPFVFDGCKFKYKEVDLLACSYYAPKFLEQKFIYDDTGQALQTTHDVYSSDMPIFEAGTYSPFGGDYVYNFYKEPIHDECVDNYKLIIGSNINKSHAQRFNSFESLGIKNINQQVVSYDSQLVATFQDIMHYDMVVGDKADLYSIPSAKVQLKIMLCQMTKMHGGLSDMPCEQPFQNFQVDDTKYLCSTLGNSCKRESHAANVNMSRHIKVWSESLVASPVAFQRTLISDSNYCAARILRAIRIAARLGFRISKETADSIKSLSYSIVRLDKGRILMERNYMMAYGSAEASLRLLWKFGLLELLLPIQAAYFVRHGFRRRDKRSNMLLIISLFSNLDKLLAPDKPCHSSLWIAILAFHKALSEQPRDALVVAAFTLAVHNGGDMLEAVEIARTITKPHEVSFHELLEPQRLDSGAYTKEIRDLEASFRRAIDHMTDAQIVSEAMAAYPQAPFSDLVFIPWGLSLRVSRIFNRVKVGGELGSVAKQGSKIDYESLAQGSLPEIRHIFARVVFDTIYPL